MDGFNFGYELTDREVEKLWEELEDVPFEEDENHRLILANDWYGWKKGTMRVDIWSWFAGNHSKGITYLVYEYEG